MDDILIRGGQVVDGSGVPYRYADVAVRDGRVLTYDTLLVARPSVQLGAAAASLARLFHPGAVR